MERGLGAAIGPLAAAMATLSSAVAVTVTGMELDRTYRPPSAWISGGEARMIDGPSDDLIQLHRGFTWALVVFSLMLLGAVAWRLLGARRSDLGRPPGSIYLPVALIVFAAAGAFAAGITAFTLRPVHWDQIGLRAVTVADDIHGWRSATDAEQVRLVLIDGVEVAPETYARIRLAHLGAPIIVGTISLGVGVAVALDLRRRRASTAEPA